MRSFAAALLASGSLAGCATQSSSTACIGAPALPMRDEVIKTMNNDELVAYNNYKSWWQTNCKDKK